MKFLLFHRYFLLGSISHLHWIIYLKTLKNSYFFLIQIIHLILYLSFHKHSLLINLLKLNHLLLLLISYLNLHNLLNFFLLFAPLQFYHYYFLQYLLPCLFSSLLLLLLLLLSFVCFRSNLISFLKQVPFLIILL